MQTVTAPGNDVTPTVVTTYGYGGDGSGERVGCPTSIQDNLQHSTTYQYDARGNVTSVTDANSQTTGLQYNDAEQVTETDYPRGYSKNTYLFAGGTLQQTETHDTDAQHTQATQTSYQYGDVCGLQKIHSKLFVR